MASWPTGTRIHPHNWKWVGRFLWLTVEYGHVVEKPGPT
jgi:hypothetical protein